MEFERIRNERKWNLFVVFETVKIRPGIIFNYFCLMDIFLCGICSSPQTGLCGFSGYNRVTFLINSGVIHIYHSLL